MPPARIDTLCAVKQPPARTLGPNGREVVGIPFLVRIGEHEVERARQRAREFVRVAEACVDVAVEPRGLEVCERLRGGPDDLDRRRLPPVLLKAHAIQMPELRWTCRSRAPA